jgi:putative transposase
LVAIDFFTVPTATFGVLFGFLVLAHDRRRVLHFNVTANPTAEWTARQLVQAFPEETAPRFLVRDRDGIYGTGSGECRGASASKRWSRRRGRRGRTPTRSV